METSITNPFNAQVLVGLAIGITVAIVMVIREIRDRRSMKKAEKEIEIAEKEEELV